MKNYISAETLEAYTKARYTLNDQGYVLQCLSTSIGDYGLEVHALVKNGGTDEMYIVILNSQGKISLVDSIWLAF